MYIIDITARSVPPPPSSLSLSLFLLLSEGHLVIHITLPPLTACGAADATAGGRRAGDAPGNVTTLCRRRVVVV